MNTTVEIDKSGRFVVPKKVRDALHLVPGTRLTICQQGDRIVLEPELKPRGLYLKKGTLVYDAGSVPPSDAVDAVARDRDARLQAISNRD